MAELQKIASDAEPENHVVVSYCPPVIEEELANPGAECGWGSQVIYIDIQSMYQPQAKPEGELDSDPVGGAGHKPQMHLPITSTVDDLDADDDLDKTAGYRPQANVNTWNLVSPDSPRSTDSNSEIVSFEVHAPLTPTIFDSTLKMKILLNQVEEDGPYKLFQSKTKWLCPCYFSPPSQ